MNAVKFSPSFTHAMRDIIALFPIITAILNLKDSSLRNNEESLDLIGKFQIVKSLDPGMYRYFLWWVKFDQSLIDFFESWVYFYSFLKTELDNLSTVPSLIESLLQYFRRDEGIKVIISDDFDVEDVSADVLEALKNAVKYSATFIKVEITNGSIAIINDIRKDIVSGTQQGLQLHNYSRQVVDGMFVAEIELMGNRDYIITMDEIKKIAKNCGWVKPLILMPPFTYGTHLLYTSRTLRFKCPKNRVKSYSRLEKILAENIDSEDKIILTVNQQFDLVDVSIGFDWYGCIDLMD